MLNLMVHETYEQRPEGNGLDDRGEYMRRDDDVIFNGYKWILLNSY